MFNNKRSIILCRPAPLPTVSSDRVIVTISIDGSSIGNGTPNATAGYGMVIKLNDSIAEYKSTLCPGCDKGLHTNNRAELRAAESALSFLHELAKMGHHKHCQIVKCRKGTNPELEDYNYVSDERSIDASRIIGIIRTDSTFVEKGATRVNRQLRHKDVWETMNNTKRCLNRGGMEIRFNHVRGHSGDWGNERADELAGEMACAGYDYEEWIPKREARCVTCQNRFKDLADLAVHYKKVHLGRDVFHESIAEMMHNGDKSGSYECTLCDRVFGSGFAVVQHVRDKHGYN